MTGNLQYSVVTPIRDESANLERLATCLVEQSVSPRRWVIVDTGSSDDSISLAHSLAHRHSWIEVVVDPQVPHGTRRGGPIVRAFEFGVAHLIPQTDVIVKV